MFVRLCCFIYLTECVVMKYDWLIVLIEYAWCFIVVLFNSYSEFC